MFAHFFKKRKIKKYARLLPRDLKQHYGKQEFYTKGQVDASLKRKRLARGHGWPVGNHCYCYAMYLNRDEFDAIQQHSSEACDYGSMRLEIGGSLFHGASDFCFDNLLSEANSANVGSGGSGWGGSDSGWGDGGGDGGGGGGD